MNVKPIAVKTLILFFLFLQTLCMAQTDPVMLYICKGTSVVLDLGTCPKAGSKISWSVQNGAEFSTLINPTVTPNKTTSYSFKCSHPDDGLMTQTVTVVVIEEVKLKNAKIEEVALTTDLTECWEESNLTFKGEVVGDIPNDLQIKYVFSWGIASAMSNKEISSNTKVANVTFKAPIVPTTSTTHREAMTVTLQIKIGDKVICSAVQKKIDLVKLWIESFSDRDGIGTYSKSWKVVIGNPIEYRVNGINDCKCDWKISGPYKNWDLNNNKNTGLYGNNLNIDYKSIYTQDVIYYTFIGENRWLGALSKVKKLDANGNPILLNGQPVLIDGPANGEVEVACKDVNGLSRTRLLTQQRSSKVGVVLFFNMEKDLRGMPPSHYNSNFLGTTKEDKDKRRIGLFVSLDDRFIKSTYFPPQWYLFWKEGGVVNELNAVNTTGKPLFVWMIEPSVYGKSTRSGTDERIALTDFAVKKNEGNGYSGQITDDNGDVFLKAGTGTGLKCLAEVMRHELYHREVDLTWGGLGRIRPGHKDTDDIPDDEETVNYRQGRFPKTKETDADTYHINYPYVTYDYSDNELRCLILERSNSIRANILGEPVLAGVVIQYYPFFDWFSNSDWSNSIYNKAWTFPAP